MGYFSSNVRGKFRFFNILDFYLANDKDKKCFSNYYITQQSLLPSIEFNSLMELRNRYPFASGKRLGNIWKFIRPYDFKDIALQISTTSIAKVLLLFV